MLLSGNLSKQVNQGISEIYKNQIVIMDYQCGINDIKIINI
jgi:hypothetical protein